MCCPLGGCGAIVVGWDWRRSPRKPLPAVCTVYSPLCQGKDGWVELKMQHKEMVIFPRDFLNPILLQNASMT